MIHSATEKVISQKHVHILGLRLATTMRNYSREYRAKHYSKATGSGQGRGRAGTVAF